MKGGGDELEVGNGGGGGGGRGGGRGSKKHGQAVRGGRAGEGVK